MKMLQSLRTGQKPAQITSLSEVCRTCLVKIGENFKSIYDIHYFSDQNENKHIIEVLQQITQNQIDDCTSQQICLECFQELQVAYEFRSRCLQANEYFETHRSRGHEFNDGTLNSSIEQGEYIKAEYESSNDGDAILNIDVHSGISPIDDDAHFSPDASTSDNKQMGKVNVTPGNAEIKRKRARRNEKPNKVDKKPNVSKQPKAKRNNKTAKGSVEVSNDGGLHLCFKCGLSFTSNSDFIKHSKTHVKEDEKFKFTCEFCQKGLRTKQQYQRHRNIHTHEQKFICDMCGKNLSNRACLMLHFRYHLNIRKFKCEFCDLRFVTSREVKDHTRAKHVMKMIACTYANCTETFDSEHWLNIHLRLHQTNYQFRCEICNVACVNKYRLHEHKRIHTGETKSPCPHCGKVLSRPQHLRRHIESLHPNQSKTPNKI